MLFAQICRDRPGHLQVRKDTRPSHVAWLNGLNERGALKFAGPFLDDGGDANGSLVVVEAPDRAGAQSIASADPYAIAGLFESVDVRPWSWTFNKPENV